jgi:hypothetical protein
MNQWQSIQNYLSKVEFAIAEQAPKNTGALADSITASIEQTSEGFTIAISMLDYGTFQDQGVNGTEVNWGSPYSFSKNIPSSAFTSYTSSISGQFAIATSVRKNGIAPKNFIQPGIDSTIEQLADFAAEDLWEYFYQQNK